MRQLADQAMEYKLLCDRGGYLEGAPAQVLFSNHPDLYNADDPLANFQSRDVVLLLLTCALDYARQTAQLVAIK